MTTPLLDPPAPAIDDGTRREFLAGGLSAGLLLTGCGGDEPLSATDTTRVVRHAKGSTRIPSRARRIVTLDALDLLQAALAVDAPVVGAAGASEAKPFADFLDTDGIRVTGIVGLPDLEEIALLRPDLILTFDDDAGIGASYRQLSRIAPTVAFGLDAEWKPAALEVADVLGRAAEMEAAITAFEERAARFRRAHRAILEATTVSVIRIREGYLDLQTDGQYFQGPVLIEAGVRRPPNQQIADKPNRAELQDSLQISREQIGEIDADVIINSGTGGGSEGSQGSTQAEFEANPLWRRLDAVRAGRVYEVSADHWFGSGPQAAELMLDDLERILIDDA